MADDIPTMNTGDVNRRLGGIAVTGEHLTALGFTPHAKDKRALLWKQSDFPLMCKAVGEFVASRANVPMQPRPETPDKGKKGAAATGNTSATPPASDDDDDL